MNKPLAYYISSVNFKFYNKPLSKDNLLYKDITLWGMFQ